MRRAPALLLLVLLVAASGCTSTVRTSERFEAEKDAIAAMAVMPPRVAHRLRTAAATVTEADAEAQAAVNAAVHEAFENVLDGTSVRLAPLALSDSAVAADPDLALTLTRAQESFEEAADVLAETKEKVLSVEVDPEVGYFADMADSDYLLFVRGESWGSTTAAARDIAVGVASALLFGGAAITQQKGLVLQVALVNANTAEVVWFNRNVPQDSNFNPADVGSVERLSRDLLKPLLGAEVTAQKKRGLNR